MKKLLLALCACVLVSIVVLPVTADENKSGTEEAGLEKYITNIYKHIDFKNCERLPYDVFDKAYRGYINLLNAGNLNAEKGILSIVDFNLPSTENRLWIIDLIAKKVLFNTYVAHGQGSGDDCAEAFSNKDNSHQSSLGFYVTGETYKGDHGISLRLNGMDNGFNDAAQGRGIVVHGADYVSEQFISGNERLGRSWGCPAVPDKLKEPIINTIQGGTCLFLYSQDKNYLEAAYWLNKKPDHLPDNDGFRQDFPSGFGG